MPAFTPFNDKDIPLTIVQNYSINRKSMAIYIGVLFFAILFPISLSFINIPLSLESVQVNRSHPGPYVLVAPVNGTLLKVLRKENQKVGSGDTLLLIETD